MAAPNNLIFGRFQDPDGNTLSFGRVEFELSADAIVNGTTAVCAGYIVSFKLDVNGDVTYSPETPALWPNDVLSPANTYYVVRAYTQAGQLAWGPNPQQIISTENPTNLSSWIPGNVVLN